MYVRYVRTYIHRSESSNYKVAFDVIEIEFGGDPIAHMYVFNIITAYDMKTLRFSVFVWAHVLGGIKLWWDHYGGEGDLRRLHSRAFFVYCNLRENFMVSRVRFDYDGRLEIDFITSS